MFCFSLPFLPSTQFALNQQKAPSRGRFEERSERPTSVRKGRLNVGSLGRYMRCGNVAARPMLSVVTRYIKRLPSGALSPLVIDQVQAVSVERNAYFMLRLTTLSYTRYTCIFRFWRQ
jgi:hypothetical protein